MCIRDRGKRLFGFIGAVGTDGALLGPLIPIWLSVPLGPVNLLVVAVLFLELGVLCAHRLEKAAQVGGHGSPGLRAEIVPPPASDDTRIGGSAFAALVELSRSPYLLGIAAVSYTHLDVYKRQTQERARDHGRRLAS